MAEEARLRPADRAVRDGQAPDGLLVVDKPAGPTSHDVVAQVRRRLAVSRAGHLGTLDPPATGLLLVAVGAATRCITLWQGGDKTYEAAIRFGVETATQDLSGPVIETREPRVDERQIRDATAAFMGAIEQVPPMVSALHHEGERLHRIARRGETVERSPRRVRVHSWEWLAFDLPEARFRVRCSGGTYVRTLAHDLGQRLGCGAALAGLRRVRSEPFGLDRSVDWEGLRVMPPEGIWERAGIGLEDALAHLPSIRLLEEEARSLGHGRATSVERARITAGGSGPGARRFVLFGPEGGALGLGEVEPEAGDPERVRLQPRVVFPWAVRARRP